MSETQAKHAKRDNHSGDTNKQQWPTTCAIHQIHREDCHADIYNANTHGRQNCTRSGIESGGLKNSRRIINYRVDAGNLLENGQAQSHHESWSDLPMQQIGPVSAFSLLRQACLDLFDLDVDVGVPSDPQENPMRNLMMTATNKPPWSFRQKKHPGAEDQRRSNGQAKHPSPTLHACKSVVGQIGNDDADGDGELKKRYNPATRVRRRDF